MQKEREPKIYIPHGAKTNIANLPMDAPVTEYEERKVIFDKDTVKKMVQGKYGKDEKSGNTGL